MFRLWCRLTDEKGNTIKDTVCADTSESNRTKKVLNSLEAACMELDTASPIWLDSNISEFKTYSKTRFRQDSFVESVDFYALEIQVIDE